MDKFNSCDSVAVVSTDARMRVRAIALLDDMPFHSLAFSSIEELSLSTFGECSTHRHAVVIVEEKLAREDLRELRTLSQFKNLVLVSQTNDEHMIVSALYSGADFYFDITEPDSLLMARLQAALRSYKDKILAQISAPPFDFDVQRRKVFLDNRPIALTPMEYKLAEYLFSRPEKVIAKSELMQSVWSLPRLAEARTRRVDTTACRIRKKMQLGSNLSGWELRYVPKMGFKLLSPTENLNLLKVMK